MADRTAARIAVIADTSLQRHVLQQALAGGGYQVVLNSDPARLDEEALAACDTDLWLVDLAQSEDSPLVDNLLEKASAPVLFGEGHAPERHSENYPRWERRLFGKLKRLVGDPAQAIGPSLEALLAEAQRPSRLELPAALPGGLPIGFVYAQHIDAAFETALPQAVGRHSQWHVNPARNGDAVRCGEVVVAPIAHELGFAEDGSMQVADRGWPEPYSPSIDQMMLNLAQQFGANCGVIAFSGMGSDGSAAAAYVRRQGGVIWTQKAESCASPSMPDSLREGGYSTLSGDPRELAAALVNHLAEQCR